MLEMWLDRGKAIDPRLDRLVELRLGEQESNSRHEFE